DANPFRASAGNTQCNGSNSDEVKVEAIARLGKAGRRDATRQDDIASPERSSRLRQVIGKPRQGDEGVTQYISPISPVDLNSVQPDNAAESGEIIPAAHKITQHSTRVPRIVCNKRDCVQAGVISVTVVDQLDGRAYTIDGFAHDSLSERGIRTVKVASHSERYLEFGA